MLLLFMKRSMQVYLNWQSNEFYLQIKSAKD